MKDINYKSISGKLIKSSPIALKLCDIVISEYNTRHDFIDQMHIDLLAAEIEKNDFYPWKALHVNLNANNRYELIVGLNRFKALLKLGYTDVLCYIYKELSPEEQVYLDAWDNRSDELHKPYHFLQEGEHYLLLLHKGWSYEKIAEIKGKGKSTIFRKIKIAKLPEQVKDIIRDSLKYQDTIFEERNFQHICSLKDPDLISEACKRIYEIGKQAARGIGRKLQNRQIKELISSMKVTVQNQKDTNNSLPGQSDSINNSEVYMQPELNFNLEPFRGKGQCVIPAWILDLMLHPEITRYERDIISYLIKETYGQNPPRRDVVFDANRIGQVTNIPAKNISNVIESLKAKGIVVMENTLLSIRDIDAMGKQMKQPVEAAIVKEVKKTDNEVNDAGIKQIKAELEKKGVSGKKLTGCLVVILERGGLPYLQAQLKYCKVQKEKGKLIQPGYLVQAIKSNYADFTSPPPPAAENNSDGDDSETVPDEKPEEKNIRLKLFDDYAVYIALEIKNRTQQMNMDEAIKLKNTLIENAYSKESAVLLPYEKKSLKDIYEELKKSGSGSELDNKQNTLYEHLLQRLYIAHFELKSFQDWKQGLNSK